MGDLGARCALLMGRLEDRNYRPENIFTVEQNGWPGDWEGRTILALTLLSRATGRTASYLKEIVAKLPGMLNERGYLGPVMPDGVTDEQQLSGHSWLLRGLLEYSFYSGDGAARSMTKGIVEQLYLPAAGRFSSYPARPEERQKGGAESGTIAGEVRSWRVSTDTGCAFISLDGLSQAYEVLGDGRIYALLSEMFEVFQTIDLMGVSAQTHATLSAARGILRLYSVTGEARFLDAARRVFDLYAARGMTQNYANFNWFSRPEWTEPCAIIDSFLVAMQLFRHTGEARYADLGRKIFRNGVCRAQRPNGGFGCDTCLTDGDFLAVHAYEAYWCCTMRGGEGLARAAQYAYFADGDAIVVPYFLTSQARVPAGGGEIAIWQRADGARDGRVRFEIEENTAAREVTLSILMPEWAENARIEGAAYKIDGRYLAVRADQSFEVLFGVPEYRDGRRRMRGDDMLGEDESARRFPIADEYLYPPEEVRARRVRVLFD